MIVELKSILPQEEIEDNFLRLKEVLDCPSKIEYFDTLNVSSNTKGMQVVEVYYNSGDIKAVFEELDQIKYRMEYIFHVKIDIGVTEKNTPKSRYYKKENEDKNLRCQIKIY